MTSQKHYSNLLFLSTTEADSLTCNECGEIFEKPVLATISSGGFSRTYYACPRCLTKVKETTSQKVEKKGGEDLTSPQKALEVDEPAGKECPHFFGFLKKRPRNMPIPDECLTCKKMIECLT
ncbi:MAG: hypothetical protein QXZ68_07595 [Candidatus Bathyarchaeia archaeon]